MQAVTDRGSDSIARDPGKLRKTEDFLAEVRKRFNAAESREARNRQQALEDLKFKAGEQWPEQIKAQRTIEKRPCLTINKVPTFVHQIVNDQRQNRPAINVSPVGDKSDPMAARMLRGLIRQIERRSRADVAYDTGFESAVSIGWGYWRIVTEYEHEDTFDQVIRVKRIRNPFRVYLDADHQEPDGSDAQWGFVSDLMKREDFQREHPDADPIAWNEGGMGDQYKNWATATHIRIAEYFAFEYEPRKLLALQSGYVGYEDEMGAELLADIEAGRDIVLKEREVQCRKVKWYKLTAHQILEETTWPGKYIPIVKVIGNETDIEGDTILSGIIRPCKDPQRMYNFWCTSETELIALAPKAPWIMEEGQVEGHEIMWKQANNKSLPYLLYKNVSVGGKPAPPPQRNQFAAPPAGVVQAKLAAAQDMQAVTGIRFDATLQERMYDESGKALRELKRVGELGNFHYIDNLARSLRYTGEIFIDLIPNVYDTARILTILREDDSEEQVKVQPNMGKAYDKEEMDDGRTMQLFNPKVGEYEVAVTIGPNFATKRAEAADSMLAFMQAVPQAGPIIGDLIAKNMDWPGAEEISARLAAMLPPGLMDKTVDQLPPEAKGIVINMMQQMQQLKQEHDQALALLGDKEADRNLEREWLAAEVAKIEKNFEAQVLKVREDYATKMAAIEAKGGEGGNPEAEMALRMAELDQKRETDMTKIAADFFAKMEQIMSNAQSQAQDRNMQARQERERMMHEQEESARKEREEEDKAKAEKKQAEDDKFMKLFEMMAASKGPKTKKIKLVAPSGKVYDAEVTEH